MKASSRVLCSDMFVVYKLVVTVGKQPIETFIRTDETVDTRLLGAIFALIEGHGEVF